MTRIALLLTLLLSLAGAARAQEGVAPSTSALRFGRLELDLPAGWTVAAPEAGPGGERVRQLEAPEQRGRAAVLLLNVTAYEGRSLEQGLRAVEAQLERGRRLLQELPLREGGTTREGFPVVVHGARSADAQGKQRLSLSFAVAVGSGFQVVTLLASSTEAFKALGGPVGVLVETARVRFPDTRDPVPAPPRGVAPTALAHLRVVVPGGLQPLKREDDQPTNLLRFQRSVLVGGKRTVPIEVRVDLQPFVPQDTRALLDRWLALDPALTRPKGAETHVLRHQDARLPSGLQLAAGLYEDRVASGWCGRRVGCVVLGPGWSLWAGAAIGEGKVWQGLDGAQRKTIGDALLADVLPALWALATTVAWTETPQDRPDLAKRLIEKKAYRWRQTSRSISADFSFYSSQKVEWAFFPDQTCTRATDGFTSFSSTSPGPAGTTQTAQTFLTDGKPATGRPRFLVVGVGAETWLVVRHGGLGRMHLLELDKQGSYGSSKSFKGLAIDGLIEGVYEDGDKYRFRKSD
ncbi:MAG: hypothetical protein AB7N76_04140 [Planctomycetota bacterium]